MANKRVVIVKFGGSVITDKRSEIPKLNKAVLLCLAKELSEYMKETGDRVVLVHGAGSFGHPMAKKHDLANIEAQTKNVTGVAATHADVSRLSSFVADALLGAGVPAFPLNTAAIVSQKKGRIVKFDTANIEMLVKKGYVPILFGDVVLDDTADFSICSGDQIIARLVKKLKPSRVVFTTDVDGIFSADPREDKKATLISVARRKEILLGVKGSARQGRHDVTGNMLGKMKEMSDMGCEVRVCNGQKKGVLLASLRGENVGTKIAP